MSLLATPPAASSSRSSPSSLGSDDSSFIELSFDYEMDENGNLVRVSKGSSSKSIQSSPTTPPKEVDLGASSTTSATLVNVPARRASLSLSRSESMPSESLAVPIRPLQRAVSGPISMPNSTAPSQPLRNITLSSALQDAAKKFGGAKRIRVEEAERQRVEQEKEKLKREAEEKRDRVRRLIEEKENAYIESRQSPPQAHARQIASLPARPGNYGFPRTARSLGSGLKPSSITRISEIEYAEGEIEDFDHDKSSHGHLGAQSHHQGTALSIPVRSKLETDIEAYLQEYQANRPVRPHSSLGIVSKARRVTIEERIRQEREIAEEEAIEREQQLESAMEDLDIHPRQSPSPTHVSSAPYQQVPGKPALHRRRDSDTFRAVDVMQEQKYLEQQHQAVLPRLSPSARTVVPTVQANQVGSAPLRHKRSPTAPEAPTTSATLSQPHGNMREALKTWAGGDKGADRVDDYGDQRGAYAPESSQRAAPQSQQGVPGPDLRKNMFVNRKPYIRLDLLGKGGSSRVFRVMDSANQIFAIKRVSLDKTDTETIQGYMNEIELLKRLEGNNRIIRLIDSEVKSGPGGSKGHLMLVMECGEIDLARLLQAQQREPLNMVWIAYYWQQILQAVQVIHDEKIVHSDLKPANFVLVKGQLKLIDFGIANAIANDTTNIHRDHQIGTVNYMSPEAVEIPEGERRLKVGRPSDVWSLGCILYQMVYGQPPFQHLSVMQKMRAIANTTHVIDFPNESVPTIPAPRNSQNSTPSPPKKLNHLARLVRRDVIRTMKRCLRRSPKERATIPELLDDDWLAMHETPAVPASAPELKEDETIINPYYMRQLLQYAIRCARERKEEQTEEEQLIEAERLVKELKDISAS